MSKNSSTIIIPLVVGFVALIFLAMYMFSHKDVPTFNEYMATTTAELTATSSAQKDVSLHSSTSTQDLLDESTSTAKKSKKSFVEATKNLAHIPLKIANKTYKVAVASTSEERAQGLSDIATMKSDEGMLFIFDAEGTYNFWMKDMLFSLDLLWVDSQKQIVKIDRGAAPSTYPNIFTTDVPVLYVLELNAGTADKCHLVIGDRVEF